jgi:site-specific recombinase XerC
LLENAPPKLIPYIAIGPFARLARAELERLDWNEIDLQSRLIEVTASKAKRRATGLENAEAVQQTLIHINEAINGHELEVIGGYTAARLSGRSFRSQSKAPGSW